MPNQQSLTRVAEYRPQEGKREIKSVVVERELKKIYKKHSVVTAELVLETATREASPLHRFFVWDDQVAAHRYRLAQAYGMILASKFVVQLVERGKADVRIVSENRQVRSLVNVIRGQGFQMRVDALRNTESRKAIVEAKKSQLRSWADSVVDIDELADIRQVILASL